MTGVMGLRYERYICHMCTMKIVAKLINFEQKYAPKISAFGVEFRCG